jgi:phage/plasmid-like protein (TIGR03299 family)
MPFGLNRDNSIAIGEFAHEGKIYRRCPNAYGTFRTDNNIPLGVVKQKYEVIQNREAFSFFDNAIGRGEAIWDKAGCFDDGRKIVVTAKLPGKINGPEGSPIDKYLVFANSHDGSCSVNIMFTPVRIICSNMLNSALDNSDSYIRIRHTSSASSRLDFAEGVIAAAIEQANNAENIYKILGKCRMTEDNVIKFISETVLSESEQFAIKEFDPVNGLKKLLQRDYYCMQSTNISMRKANTFAKMYDYYLNGVGQNEILGTAWGAYNAITGYYSNVVEMEPRKRMDSLTWGTANHAMNVALYRAYDIAKSA